MAEMFEDSHHRTYGHRGHDNIVELVNLHLVANGVTGKPRVPEQLEFPGTAGAKGEARSVWFGPELGSHATTVVSRSALGSNMVRGPLIVSEFDTTILVPPDFGVMRDGSFNVVLAQFEQGSAAHDAPVALTTTG